MLYLIEMKNYEKNICRTFYSCLYSTTAKTNPQPTKQFDREAAHRTITFKGNCTKHKAVSFVQIPPWCFQANVGGLSGKTPQNLTQSVQWRPCQILEHFQQFKIWHSPSRWHHVKYPVENFVNQIKHSKILPNSKMLSCNPVWLPSMSTLSSTRHLRRTAQSGSCDGRPKTERWWSGKQEPKEAMHREPKK